MKHSFPLTGRDPCKSCGGGCVVRLDVSPTGYSVGTDFDHLDSCPETMCPHGFKWKDSGDCAQCEAEDDARAAAEAAERAVEEAEMERELAGS
jgi:hypothetical protein